SESDEQSDPDERLDDFLEPERYIESDHDEIRQIAAGLEGDDEMDLVKQIYDFVLDHMEYVKSGTDDKGAIVALERGKGDCTEYADLFVAICRASDIPARVVTGYTVQTDTATSKHNWAEVYLQDRGWVPFDPAVGDKQSPIFRNKAFGRMMPVYIYLSHVRNDYVLDNHNFGAFKYWGDGISLTDSIEFRLPDQSTVDSR
ncbi:MAG: transglutaminase-like domain-containing protein, partial [Planctomycetota bacterium]